jgi:hypothetical protein
VSDIVPVDCSPIDAQVLESMAEVWRNDYDSIAFTLNSGRATKPQTAELILGTLQATDLIHIFQTGIVHR